MAPPKSRFSLFGIGGGGADAGYNSKKIDSGVPPPVLKLQTNKNVYRPGDPVIITIEIQNPQIGCSLLVEKLSFEIKGIEKLDRFTTQKPESKQKRGEYVFMDCSVPSVFSNQIVSSGATRTCSPLEVRCPCNHLQQGLLRNIHISKNAPAYLRTCHHFPDFLRLRSYMTPLVKSSAIFSPSHQLKHSNSLTKDDESGIPSGPGAAEPVASEGFIRGRSYNIRLDDKVLLRFSPKNSESTYYFSDMIGGTLTFFHEEGSRRCVELSITLEMSETINRRSVHPSRRHSPTITKVQSDHHEVVADLVQTSFLFSIPMDGPMSFSTRHVSVQWALRFEFLTTPKNVDWTRYEHPLLIEGRDKCEWVLPITVHAPPQVTSAAHIRNEKPFSLEPLWVHT